MKPSIYPRLLSVRGVFAAILIGLLIVAPYDRKNHDTAKNASILTNSSNIDEMSAEELRALVVKALSKLEERQALNTGDLASVETDPKERGIYSWQDVEHGVGNIRRLLPSVQRWMLEALHDATENYAVKQSDWPRINRLVGGVHRITFSEGLRGVAAVRDDKLSEILVDPAYAPYLISDDEAVFVLAHELTHVAARSNKLDRFIKGVADNVKRNAAVEPTEAQREDLACDLIGELVLKRFIALKPTSESMTARVSTVFGYESPEKRFERAWEEFCAAYNGDPGDDDHLTQYQTIRALLALDPDLRSLMPKSARSLYPACEVPAKELDKN